MLVATLVAAVIAGQTCPQPLSANGPPPCAAANVPGCLPGYHRVVDAYGRVRYVCDQPAAQQAPPEAPPPPAYAPPPPAYAPPAPRYAAPWSPPPPRRGVIGLVLMPGISSVPRDTPYFATHDTLGAGAVALELRPDWGGGRLRVAFDGTRYMRALEAGLKYDFFEHSQVRPFLALGIGGGTLDPDPNWRLSGSISAGLDVYLSQNVFLTMELKGRAFTERAAAADYGIDPGSVHQTQFFMGVGFYF